MQNNGILFKNFQDELTQLFFQTPAPQLGPNPFLNVLHTNKEEKASKPVLSNSSSPPPLKKTSSSKNSLRPAPIESTSYKASVTFITDNSSSPKPFFSTPEVTRKRDEFNTSISSFSPSSNSSLSPLVVSPSLPVSPVPISSPSRSALNIIDITELDEEEVNLLSSTAFFDLTMELDGIGEEQHENEYEGTQDSWEVEEVTPGNQQVIESLYSEQGMISWIDFEIKAIETKLQELDTERQAELAKLAASNPSEPAIETPIEQLPSIEQPPPFNLEDSHLQEDSSPFSDIPDSPSSIDSSPEYLSPDSSPIQIDSFENFNSSFSFSLASLPLLSSNESSPEVIILSPIDTQTFVFPPPVITPTVNDPNSLEQQSLRSLKISASALARTTSSLPEKLRNLVIQIRLFQSKLHRLRSHPYKAKSTRMPHRRRKNLNGDVAFVEESESLPDCTVPLPPLVFQLSSQEEEVTQVAYETFTNLLNSLSILTWLRSGPGDTKQNRQREWLLYPEMRVLAEMEEITLLRGLEDIKSVLIPRMIQGGTKDPLILIFHFQYSTETILQKAASVMESDVQILLSFARSCGGGRKLRLNYCCRLTMFVAKHLLEYPQIRIGELQFLQRLIEDKFWMIFEECNDSAEHSRPNPLVTPLYLTFARDEVAFQLVPIDEVISHQGITFVRREWFFQRDHVPYLYDSKKWKIKTKNSKKGKKVGPAVGVTQYFHLFSEFEQNTIDTHITNLDKSFEIVLIQELAKVAIWPEKFSNMKITLKCDECNITLRANPNKRDNEIKWVSTPTTIIDLEEQFESKKSSENSSKRKRSSKSHGSSKKHRGPSRSTICCSRMHLVKIFQKASTFLELFNRGLIRVKHNHHPKKLLSFLDELCSSVTDQAHLTCHRMITDTCVQRTKFFFNLSYLWTDKQLQEKGACWAAFCRSSVPQPAWISDIIERKLINAGLVQKGFFTSSAINIYHTGNTGLLPHFDDDTRFTPPIFSYQPYSGKRLAFGAITTRMTNCLMMIPLPRGCVTVLEKDSFACRAVKHCARPQDMNGPSAALLMRHIPSKIMKKARRFTPHKAAAECDHKVHSNSGKNVKVLESGGSTKK